MPFNINSCLCNSTLSIDSFVDTSSTAKHSTQSIHTSSGYVTTSTKVKASDIKPQVSYLHPKLRISTEEYTQHKERIDSMGGSNKNVYFDDASVRSERAFSGVYGIQTSLTAAPISALDDDDTDFVPFEEFEPWRLQRLKYQVSTTPSDSDTIQASQQSESSAFSIEQAISTEYDIPKKQTISTEYDIPRKQTTSTEYDIPRKQTISTEYDIPRKQTISTEYDIPRKQTISTEYDIPIRKSNG